MWAIENRTRYGAERSWTRDQDGAHHWVVAVKVSFAIAADGKLSLADEQPPPLLEPQYFGDPASTALRLDSDLLAVKPGTDVILDAQAHAPRGRPVESVPVSLRAGPISKTLLVHGPRVYYKGVTSLTTSKPRPFTTAPLRYESAFGGADLTDRNPSKHRIDARNPIGTGFAVNPDRLVHQPAHRIEYPQGDPARNGPAGFGPIASFWSPRRELAGTYDARWEKSRKPLLPENYDARFAHSAPADQQVARPLRGGEPVELTNLTAAGRLSLELPKIFLTFTTRIGRRTEEHRAAVAAVIILPETMRLMMVWQSSLRVLGREVEHLDSTSISEKRYLT